MKQVLMICAGACLALFLFLSWAFDAIQASSRAGAEAMEASVEAVSQ